MPRHDNAKSPTVSPYYRQNPSLHKQIDGMIGDGMSNECIYSDLLHRETTTVSQTIRASKVISNRRYYAKHFGKSYDFEKGEEETEAQLIIKYVKEGDFIRTVTFTKDKYFTINFLNWNDERYGDALCGKGGILSIVTTFEICDGLRLTDSSYPNLTLVNHHGNSTHGHPTFLGPSFWHFRKERESYKRFATEPVVENPLLVNLPKIEKWPRQSLNAWVSGYICQFVPSLVYSAYKKNKIVNSYVCRVQARPTRTHFNRYLRISKWSTSSKWTCRRLWWREKLCSLENVWNDIVPGFYDWFRKYRYDMFTGCLILTARRKFGTEERFCIGE